MLLEATTRKLKVASGTNVAVVAATSNGWMPLPNACGAVWNSKLVRPYSNQATVPAPFGLTDPLRTGYPAALVPAAKVRLLGAWTGTLKLDSTEKGEPAKAASTDCTRQK